MKLTAHLHPDSNRDSKHTEGCQSSGVQRSAGRKEQKKGRCQEHKAALSSKDEWNNGLKVLSRSRALVFTLHVPVTSPVCSRPLHRFCSTVLYLRLPLQYLRLLHTYVGHKSAMEKDSGQEERERQRGPHHHLSDCLKAHLRALKQGSAGNISQCRTKGDPAHTGYQIVFQAISAKCAEWCENRSTHNFSISSTGWNSC